MSVRLYALENVDNCVWPTKVIRSVFRSDVGLRDSRADRSPKGWILAVAMFYTIHVHESES